jgi:acetyl esterase/lipase
MEKLLLWSDRKSCGGEDDFQPYLELSLLPGDEARGMVIVCPGGGYSHRAAHEGGPVAEKFNGLGFHAAVLQYRTAPYRYPAPQEDVLRSVKIIRSRAAEWRVKNDKIAVLGFSAGGHLACSSGIVFDEVRADNGDAADAVSARPDATILCYPVISGVNMPHNGSFMQLLGEARSMQELKAFSWECRVKDNTPPSFLWHTAADPGVPVENSLNFAAALRAKNIPFELHVFPHGRHGLGLGVDDNVAEIRVWPELCATWLRKMDW